MDGQRVMEVWGPTSSGGIPGSGYLVAPRLVLTAHHVVASAQASHAACQVRLFDPEGDTVWEPGKVVWPTTTREFVHDVALIEITGEAWHPPAVEPVRWGLVTPGPLVPFEALGFPDATVGLDQRRDSKEARGDIETGSLQKSRRLLLNARSSVPLKEREKGSWWQGMSGSAVFAGPLLVGVLVVAPGRAMNPEALIAIPTSLLAELATFTALLDEHATPLVIEDARAPEAAEDLAAILATDVVIPIGSADPYRMGVFPSDIARDTSRGIMPYVARAIDPALYALLADETALDARQRLVIVRGDPKCGKSRTLFEALKAIHPRRPLIALRTPLETDPGSAAHRPLHTLLRLPPATFQRFPQPPVVWIDDAQRHLQRGLTSDNLRRIRDRLPGLIIAATLHDHVIEQIQKLDEPLAHLLRSASENLYLDPVLTSAEVEQARELYALGGVSTQHVLRLPELFAAVNILKTRYRDHRFDQSIGTAIVQAAVTWQRAGMPPTIDQFRLYDLTRDAYSQRFPHREITQAEFSKGVTWATEEVAAYASLLHKIPYTDPPSYEVFDAITRWISDQESSISPHTWDYIEAHATPDVALSVGVAAYFAQEETRAERLFRITSLSEHADAPVAAFNLGVLLENAGKPEQAQTAYQRAIDSNHPDVAAKAAFNLGVLLENAGKPEQAQTAYQRAIDSNHPDAAPTAATNLGVLLAGEGKSEQAQTAYQRAIDSNHPDQAPKAATNLGVLLAGEGKSEQAQTAYQLAIDSNHPDQAPEAAFNLGVLLAGEGKSEQAQTAYQRAIDSNHPDQAPEAAFNLGVLLAGEGKSEQAQTAYQLAIDSNHPDQAPMAAFNLGMLLENAGKSEQAQTAYQRAIDSNHPDQAPEAAFNLGVLLENAGKSEQAQTAYQRAIDSNHPDWAPTAATNLGVLLAEEGKSEQAQTAFQHAIDSNHPDQAPMAAFNLGVLLAGEGKSEQAQTAYQLAIGSNHPDWAPEAAFNLGVLLAGEGKFEQAQAAFQLAIDSNDPDVAANAATSLGKLRSEQHN